MCDCIGGVLELFSPVFNVRNLAGIFLIYCLALLVWVFLLKNLWNITIPEIFNLDKIGYWQSFKLLLITFILFGWAFVIR